MLSGDDSARLATTMTMGSLMGAVTYTTSFIRARPWDAVAVKVRAPTAAAPRQALMAECSDSTGMYSASSSPLATSSARCSTMWVCGVMGYAATTSGLQSLTASATAMDTSTPIRVDIYSTSSCMVMTLGQHSRAQTPQPLQ